MKIINLDNFISVFTGICCATLLEALDYTVIEIQWWFGGMLFIVLVALIRGEKKKF